MLQEVYDTRVSPPGSALRRWEDVVAPQDYTPIGILTATAGRIYRSICHRIMECRVKASLCPRGQKLSRIGGVDLYAGVWNADSTSGTRYHGCRATAAERGSTPAFRFRFPTAGISRPGYDALDYVSSWRRTRRGARAPLQPGASDSKRIADASHLLEVLRMVVGPGRDNRALQAELAVGSAPHIFRDVLDIFAAMLHSIVWDLALPNRALDVLDNEEFRSWLIATAHRPTSLRTRL